MYSISITFATFKPHFSCQSVSFWPSWISSAFWCKIQPNIINLNHKGNGGDIITKWLHKLLRKSVVALFCIGT